MKKIISVIVLAVIVFSFGIAFADNNSEEKTEEIISLINQSQPEEAKKIYTEEVQKGNEFSFVETFEISNAVESEVPNQKTSDLSVQNRKPTEIMPAPDAGEYSPEISHDSDQGLVQSNGIKSDKAEHNDEPCFYSKTGNQYARIEKGTVLDKNSGICRGTNRYGDVSLSYFSLIVKDNGGRVIETKTVKREIYPLDKSGCVVTDIDDMEITIKLTDEIKQHNKDSDFYVVDGKNGYKVIKKNSIIEKNTDVYFFEAEDFDMPKPYIVIIDKQTLHFNPRTGNNYNTGNTRYKVTDINDNNITLAIV